MTTDISFCGGGGGGGGDSIAHSQDELCDLVARHGGTSWYRPTDRDNPVTHTIAHKLAQTKVVAIAQGRQAVHTQGKVR